MILHWSNRLLTAEDLRRHLNGQRELVLDARTVVTPLATDELRDRDVCVSRIDKITENGNGTSPLWGFAQESKFPMVVAAVETLRREGMRLHQWSLPVGPICQWAKRIATFIADGDCSGGVVFCNDPGLVCCVANKIRGIRGAAVSTTTHAARATLSLGANLLAVEMPGRTYFEVYCMIRQLCESKLKCPPATATTLTEMENHANR